MIKKRRFPRIYFGWWTAIAGGILNLWGYGFQFYGFSALFKPIASELGFNRAVTSVAASIGRLEGGIEAPITGWLTDKFGPRWIVLPGVFVIGLSLILMNFVNSLWAFYLVWGVMLGTGVNVALSLPLDTAIANWFVKKRGTAMSIRAVLSGLCGVLVLPLIAWLITIQGWRMTCVIGGVVMWLIGLPIAWFFLKRERPEYYGLLPDGVPIDETADKSQMVDRGVKYAAEVQEVEFTLRQAMKTPAYWLLVLSQSVLSLAMPAISIHGIPFLTDIGIEPLKAASMLAMMLFVGLPLRFIGGFLTDHVAKKHLRFLMGGGYSLQAVGFAIFLLNQTVPMIYVWFIVYGIGHGLTYTLNSLMRGRYFGRKAFGSIGGVSRALMMPAGVVAPIWFGWVYDTSGSYISGFTLVAALLAGAAILMFFVVPPKPLTEMTDISQIE